MSWDFVMVRSGAWMRVSVCMGQSLSVLISPRGGASELSYQLSQMWGRRRGERGLLKNCHQHQNIQNVSSCYGATGSAMSWVCWGAGSIKDPLQVTTAAGI